MPNHVTNRITLGARNWTSVVGLCFRNNQLDFASLIPEPPQMYLGDLSSDDAKDFKCNWQAWRIENWGTKWNAYKSSYRLYEDQLLIFFDTAWSVPYPFIAAFANTFKVAFEHAYFDEGGNFWGVESWVFEDDKSYRTKVRKSLDADYAKLRANLKGDSDAKI